MRGTKQCIRNSASCAYINNAMAFMAALRRGNPHSHTVEWAASRRLRSPFGEQEDWLAFAILWRWFF